jgi:hypothetical protein
MSCHPIEVQSVAVRDVCPILLCVVKARRSGTWYHGLCRIPWLGHKPFAHSTQRSCWQQDAGCLTGSVAVWKCLQLHPAVVCPHVLLQQLHHLQSAAALAFLQSGSPPPGHLPPHYRSQLGTSGYSCSLCGSSCVYGSTVTLSVKSYVLLARGHFHAACHMLCWSSHPHRHAMVLLACAGCCGLRRMYSAAPCPGAWCMLDRPYAVRTLPLLTMVAQVWQMWYSAQLHAILH